MITRGHVRMDDGIERRFGVVMTPFSIGQVGLEPPIPLAFTSMEDTSLLPLANTLKTITVLSRKTLTNSFFVLK